MSIRKTTLVEGEYYHVYNRGNGKQKIFLDDEDYERFIKLLYICNSEKKINFREEIVNKNIDAFEFKRGQQIVSMGAWVLMPNHFHVYITIPKGPAFGENKKEEKNSLNTISLFINKVCTSYSMYFNRKYKRTGSLFEGRFKSVHIKNDNQAKYLFSYIHLNPIKLIQSDWKDIGIKNKKEALDFLDNYKWGSYLDYLYIERKESKILNRENFLNYFDTKELFQKEILEWISPKARPLGDLMDDKIF
ncbi:TPA: hypothetical protein DCX66_03715 [Candidatus Nomurabacteria bacterium]|uniref:Transposase IS200-like domain-containing protein n=1 Tax=Candidatus Nomurabacteria bacterium GW2011_GWE1_35_16 TaxID=1618761 RepID=A0A0G0BT51_9BACT|nr:MAG: hypothetical protein UR55_C0001G0005 [Candidatus Nomurabacteria bacterium GW2011_GWF1_34_20]KKP63714.1 MAG: hypothetical protein UR57_C0001G0005 [Candidatus Nomurabacteria bacterium GW2011_GWE2_34_25]KKP66926.1 MAG: hypothetical protein UR64_C0001G0005 [Candidatus Nomurabacteria bacterium GW2011_GWE1_35_16]HAE36751.1 hypothetical protein [Candidatus Nomurabacteria bacterium]HAX65546.1 hypothetical protein [Candidatus Nomurabacteria bacterium]